ncbi:hypothetical protein BT96DRAFT_829549, partial [Gymnopus androsaceus JB14]
LQTHFKDLAEKDQIPEFSWFLEKSEWIVNHHMSFEMYEQALSKKANESAPDEYRFPTGDPYTALITSVAEPIADPSKSGKSKEKRPTAYEEKVGFDGDHVLANSILFKMEYSFWIEAAYAIAEGDIGCIWEIMKIFMFIFAGGGNNNYINLLIEMYCLFQYKSSKDLKDAIWNNWLVNVTGELGKWIPNDLLQEHYNQWLENIIKKQGGNFDNDFL